MSYETTSGKPESLENVAEPTPRDAINDRERYSRQVLFAPIGEHGQQRLATRPCGHRWRGGHRSRDGQPPGARRCRPPHTHRPRLRRALQPPAPGALRRGRRPRVSSQGRGRAPPPRPRQLRRPRHARRSPTSRHATPRRSSAMPTSSSTARTTSRPATSSTISACATAARGSTPPPSAPTPRR